MKRRRGLFGPFLFIAGWGLHAVVAYFWTTSAPSPQILLLAALAVGASGKINTGQTLGFLWGLMLDVQGASLFGCQGWILAAAGFFAGKMSRQIDGERLSAQVLLAAGGTLFHLAAFAQAELLFRRGAPHIPGAETALLQALLNIAVAPLVFRAVQELGRYIPSGEEDHVFKS